MNQKFNYAELRRHLHAGELLRGKFKESTFIQLVEENERNILDGNFEFDIRKNSPHFLIEGLAHKLILRKLNDIIKRIYKNVQSDRNFIIQQVKALLCENAQLWIIKADIKSFYENINRDRILKKLRADGLLQYHSMLLCRKLFEHPLIESTTGMPRGMNISASLSEIYMRKFDESLQRSDNVFYYARFVDDIIIFVNEKKSAETIFSSLNNSMLEKCSLELNVNKTELRDGISLKQLKSMSGRRSQDNYIEYLGYRFSALIDPESKVRELKVSVADKKVKKIKMRIVKSYLDYGKNMDFDLLKNRISFLTGNYSIRKNGRDDDLRVGIYYNYHVCRH